ncbi:tRNA pseudouridine(38-40) synthase TruA [Aestuariivirga sp.]|uniref:tRNA pseudouridine(38-40) synthase TruA n=1 Tax=Aestuariivirga sp. TaxID=2650926 RepID=UPI0039E58A12
MPRYKLTIEYDGTGFFGWQMQADQATVQGVLEKALQHIHGVPVLVQGAGRTDTGVHAIEQVAHVDLPKSWDPFVLRNAINGNVRPHPVSVLEAEEVGEDFHARFSAVKRSYLYRILNRRAPPSLDLDRVWHVPVEMDAEAMHEAAQYLVGKHDFTTFRAADCQAQSPVKTLDRFDVARYGEEIEIRAEARSFLHHQVRSMVGSLKYVGEGKWQPIKLKKALEAKNRAACGVVAPPHGLYLVSVGY